MASCWRLCIYMMSVAWWIINALDSSTVLLLRFIFSQHTAVCKPFFPKHTQFSWSIFPLCLYYQKYESLSATSRSLKKPQVWIPLTIRLLNTRVLIEVSKSLKILKGMGIADQFYQYWNNNFRLHMDEYLNIQMLKLLLNMRHTS